MRCPARRLVAVAAAGFTACVFAAPARGQLQLTSGAEELKTVTSARQALDEFGNLQIESIPPAMLNAAEGVAIFPNMIKGGFILGVNYGKGVLMVRRPDRTWSPPVMVTMGGGSVGFQAGVQAADIVLVFATPRSLVGLMNGQKVTLGADASVALGPIGRQANAATDARMGAEIYSYARSRGLFLGVSLGGADLAVDHNADAMLYGRFGVTPDDVFQARGLAFHPEVRALIDDMNARTAARPATPAGQPQPAPRQAAVPPATVPIQPQPGTQSIPQPAPIGTQPLAPLQPIQPPPAAPAVPAVPSYPPGANPPLVPIR